MSDSPLFAPFQHAAQSGQSLLQGLAAALPLSSWAAASPRLAQLQADYQARFAQLWMGTLARERGEAHEPVVQPDKGDRRFAAAEWRDNAYYDFLRQSYLLSASFMRSLVEAVDVDERARERLRFHARQYLDAISPANFAATNPEALKAALDSNGETLARGIKNLIGDVEKGRISTTDETAFEVGRNLAITPGAVIFENEVMQLIQYAPTTPKVRARPLVMVPPCINKYYILDLSAESSFVAHAVAQGHTVFMVSWRNITAETGHLTWDDYIRDGVLKALEVARAVRKADRVNALGFCVGGTMLGTALAVLAARNEQWVESATFLTTMLDFAQPGDLGVFVDEASVRETETKIGQGGVKPGSDLAGVFSTLRANDLVWPYVVNNYLKGKSPAAFDILYWNGDSTNLAGPWYCWYVRNAYLENRLREPGALTVCGEKLDLRRVDVPVYLLATREDHIVPWRSAYRSNGLLAGERRFVLGASGHIAGVINPANKNRRSYWVNETLSAAADEWLAGAREQQGSWWNDWSAWLERFGGELVAAPKKAGNAKFKPLEDAPGRYVKHRVV